jgi:CRISPR-associated exonuclease Cas4
MFSIHYKNMFLKGDKIGVNVSELVTYLLCPRKLYYACRGHEPYSDITISYIEHLLLKELGMNLPELLVSCSSKDDAMISYIEDMLSQAADELPLIYSSELADTDVELISEASKNLGSNISEINTNIRSFISDSSNTSLVSQLKDAEPGFVLYSEKLNLSGIPHLVLNIDEVQVPLIIKTGKYPETGVWSNDRLHLTALAMLMGASSSKPVISGIVLYAIHGKLRHVTIRSIDRRQILKVIGRIKKIKEGSMPDKKTGSLCQTCAYGSTCNVNSSLASKFF